MVAFSCWASCGSWWSASSVFPSRSSSSSVAGASGARVSSWSSRPPGFSSVVGPRRCSVASGSSCFLGCCVLAFRVLRPGFLGFGPLSPAVACRPLRLSLGVLASLPFLGNFLPCCVLLGDRAVAGSFRILPDGRNCLRARAYGQKIAQQSSRTHAPRAVRRARTHAARAAPARRANPHVRDPRRKFFREISVKFPKKRRDFFRNSLSSLVVLALAARLPRPHVFKTHPPAPTDHRPAPRRDTRTKVSALTSFEDSGHERGSYGLGGHIRMWLVRSGCCGAKGTHPPLPR